MRDGRKKATPDTVPVARVLQLIAREEWGQLRSIAAIHLFEDRAQFTGPVIATFMVLQQLNRLRAPVIALNTIFRCFSNSEMPSNVHDCSLSSRIGKKGKIVPVLN